MNADEKRGVLEIEDRALRGILDLRLDEEALRTCLHRLLSVGFQLCSYSRRGWYEATAERNTLLHSTVRRKAGIRESIIPYSKGGHESGYAS